MIKNFYAGQTSSCSNHGGWSNLRTIRVALPGAVHNSKRNGKMSGLHFLEHFAILSEIERCSSFQWNELI